MMSMSARIGPAGTPLNRRAAGRRAARRVAFAAVVLLVGVTVLGLLAGLAAAGDPDHQVRTVARQVRCPFCKNISAWDSTTTPARQIVVDIRERLAAGETEAEILRAYEEMYGPWILMAPPRRGAFWIAWLTPFAAVAVGGGILVTVLRRWLPAATGRGSDSGASPPAGPVPVDGDVADPARPPDPAQVPALRRQALAEFQHYL